jgi:hypothetical protein
MTRLHPKAHYVFDVSADVRMISLNLNGFCVTEGIADFSQILLAG